VEIWRGLPCAESVNPFLHLSCLLLGQLSLPPYSLSLVVGGTMGNSNLQSDRVSKIKAGCIEKK
jgi:hypothetical protein